MEKVKVISELAPLVRIGLFIFSGYLANAGYDNTIVQYIRTDPEVAGMVLAGATALWYAAAKIWNWKR
jgi:hypothetical protein